MFCFFYMHTLSTHLNSTLYNFNRFLPYPSAEKSWKETFKNFRNRFNHFIVVEHRLVCQIDVLRWNQTSILSKCDLDILYRVPVEITRSNWYIKGMANQFYPPCRSLLIPSGNPSSGRWLSLYALVDFVGSYCISYIWRENFLCLTLGRESEPIRISWIDTVKHDRVLLCVATAFILKCFDDINERQRGKNCRQRTEYQVTSYHPFFGRVD